MVYAACLSDVCLSHFCLDCCLRDLRPTIRLRGRDDDPLLHRPAAHRVERVRILDRERLLPHGRSVSLKTMCPCQEPPVALPFVLKQSIPNIFPV